MDSKHLETRIKNKAYELGYDLCGIIKADPIAEYVTALDERIVRYPEYRHLYDDLYEFAYPQDRAAWAKSIIVCIRRYGKYKIPEKMSKYIGKLYLFDSRLEYSQEYSNTKAFDSFLKDAGLLMHKDGVAARWAAVKAGLGVFGKNNFIYTQFGSWVRINTWIVDKEMEYDEPANKSSICPPNCRKCIDACPTQALCEPFMMNRGICVAELSYYPTGLTPAHLRVKMGTWLYGCDVCQNVCPLNKNRWDAGNTFPRVDELAEYITLEKIAEMDEGTFFSIVQPRFSYIKKDGLWIWKCNALRAMVNSNDENYHKYIIKACNDSNENIRNMAIWGRDKLGL
ncbi:MAG TPA: 4Fe-4S double cluster binding domain-containing protein [Methylomusa anaerophila]|uniref:Epoxyqueuosine reductase n=1 Tax=Methylomusa anaerophila TaxID=1930071 RepID=A0A348AF48_9FIRM|nr:4Fe-4S double cluster binding domain-containing protein [Methylomusa anaerophila]BBB89696.1 epoxyqueuosine reductase [Methylomusa anaerophila]HML89260.1 4Fe-4S double cluster binding domain-containing protein [Methylomusa anaerophila]